MGVYIKGIKVPAIVKVHYLNGRRYVEDPQSREWREMVEIPPHGRLGDLDRILEIIDGIWDCNDMTFKPNDHCCDVPKDCHGCKWAETKRAIREIVANAPTIIPAEEEKV